MQPHVGQATIWQSLIYFVDVMSKILIAVISHAGKSSAFLFVTVATLFTRFIRQHIAPHFTHGLVVPYFPHGVFFEISHWMFGFA
jgi:hypothetical protein